MSMLAEKRRKQKWSLNPRGKEWSQDANKFGQKLLEKMGWQHGKGLGAKENGVTEHVKVSYKNDSKGIGYKETNDQWTEHETNFSALLQSLTGDGENGIEEIKVSSLEKKSQISRARVHYHKFTRGKDLSRASEKDLANIFGKKSLKDTKKPVKKEDPDSKECENNSGFLINAGSMRDYFRKKLPNFGKVNGCVIGNNGVLKKEESESESELRPSFGFGFNATEERTSTLLNKDNSESESEIISHSGFGFINESDDNTPSKKPNSKSKVVPITDKNNIDGKRKAEEKDDTILSPKKKSKKEKGKTEENLGVSNPAFNPMSTPIKVQKHLLDPIEESLTEEIEEIFNVSKNKNEFLNNTDKSNEESITDSSKKKKIRKSEFSNPNFNEETENSIEEMSTMSNPYEISNKKLKKNKKIELDGIEGKASKKEKKKNKIMESDTNSFEEKNLSQIEESSFEISSIKSKKKQKSHEIDNPNFDVSEDNSINISQIIVENPYEVKPKKNKKQKKIELDNPNFDVTEDSVIDISQLEENPYEVKPKKKKQKKTEVVNPNFDVTEDSVTDTSQLEENPYEVKPNKKKKKKNNNLAIDNPSFSEQEEKPIDSINPYEVKSKKLKKKEVSDPGIANPALNLNDSKNDDAVLENCDLILNVVSTPIVSEVPTNSTNTTKSLGTITKIENLRNRKSVRFSDITQELIIPNNEELKEMYKKDKSKKKKKGLDNLNFDKQQNNLDENVNTISKTLDNYQAEIENDMNEEKVKTVTVEDLMVGEVGNPNGENEKLPDGTKLKFKQANLDGKTAFYMLDKVGPKKSYKHLIKGDILVKFKNTNLHQIRGYAVNNKT